MESTSELICIVGGSGFIGSRLAECLKTDVPVTILDKRPVREPGKYHSVLCDIRDSRKLNTLFPRCKTVILLAAEHRDDVDPVSLYYDVNVEGTRNVLAAMDALGIRNIVFTSTVAVYGINKSDPGEDHPADPFNHYGKSKLEAEKVLLEWYEKDTLNRSLTIIRPTVVFGETNRGNVYTLLSQIYSGRFLMVGGGKNVKSMAYVGNVAEFIKFVSINSEVGLNVFNYVDKPDLTTTELIDIISDESGKDISRVQIPFVAGMLAGYFFDMISFITGRKFSVSSVRVKKFCATTQFHSDNIGATGFTPRFKLEEGIRRTIRYEFENSGDFSGG